MRADDTVFSGSEIHCERLHAGVRVKMFKKELQEVIYDTFWVAVHN